MQYSCGGCCRIMVPPLWGVISRSFLGQRVERNPYLEKIQTLNPYSLQRKGPASENPGCKREIPAVLGSRYTGILRFGRLGVSGF